MFDIIYRFFRNRRIRKYVSDVETGLIPLSSIKTANVVIDVEEPGFDVLKEDIMAWARNTGIKVNIYFFDFRRIGKDELLLTSITNTLLKKELDWTGMPDLTKVAGVIEEKSDLFISMLDNGNFPIEGPVGLAAIWEVPWLNDGAGIALMTIAWVLLFRKITTGGWFYKKIVLQVSKSSYGMYLCHMLLLATVSAWIRSTFGLGGEGIMGIWTTPVQILSAAVISFIGVAVFCVLVRKIPKVGKWIIG